MKTGRPRFCQPEDVSRAVDQMIRDYNTSGDVGQLTDYQLLDRLRISSRTLERYYDGTADRALIKELEQKAAEAGAGTDTEIEYNNTSIQPEDSTISTYGGALKRLIEYRRAEAVRHIAGGGASTTITGWIFLSKQPHWGGFQDVQRTEARTKQDITVTITGADGKALRE